jgi:hypothetical protein
MGGAVAEISDFPYTVSIKKHGQHYCGGSLVNSLSFKFNLDFLIHPAMQ